MKNEPPTREGIATMLQLIKARQLQLQREVRDLGYAAAKCSRQLLELPERGGKQNERKRIAR
jgi:hypothetical protein